jgi:hypothetical protein
MCEVDELIELSVDHIVKSLSPDVVGYAPFSERPLA